MADCRDCHQFIAPDRPEIRKVMGYWERKEPIPWLRDIAMVVAGAGCFWLLVKYRDYF